jgi:hypothetical protein
MSVDDPKIPEAVQPGPARQAQQQQQPQPKSQAQHDAEEVEDAKRLQSGLRGSVIKK